MPFVLVRLPLFVFLCDPHAIGFAADSVRVTNQKHIANQYSLMYKTIFSQFEVEHYLKHTHIIIIAS